ncbi:MAG: hypothetical protein JNL11_19725 [Bdellovibrionaceae bacterium]|nr:hypothetical protein [Pseudobdellovibrionaceae bacterium]
MYFSLPKIANSLGCSPGKNSVCFDKLKNFARTNADASKNAKASGAAK